MASSEPVTYQSNEEPQPGDLIEIFRPAYQHWALYLGDGYIINLTPVGQCHVSKIAQSYTLKKYLALNLRFMFLNCI